MGVVCECACSDCGGQKGELGHLGLQLQIIVNHHGFWHLISGLLGEQPVLLINRSSLQSLLFYS